MLNRLLFALSGAALMFAMGCSSDEPARQPTPQPVQQQVYYPAPCEQMRSCVQTYGQVDPGNRHHYDQAWRDVENTARAGKTQDATDMCARALRTYSTRPGAPASCR
jgi:hypothetical protein